MITMTLYDIQVWDGGDRRIHKHYTNDKLAAEAWQAKYKNDLVSTRVFHIAESVEELFELDTGMIAERALAKLTTAEKVALGLIK